MPYLVAAQSLIRHWMPYYWFRFALIRSPYAPWFWDGDSVIEFVVGKRSIDQARLTCDGEIAEELLPGDRIKIRKADQKVCLIHPTDYDHFSILRAKLNWGK